MHFAYHVYHDAHSKHIVCCTKGVAYMMGAGLKKRKAHKLAVDTTAVMLANQLSAATYSVTHISVQKYNHRVVTRALGCSAFACVRAQNVCQ